MTPDEAQIVLLSRRIDALETQVGDAINGLMMIAQAMQFWSNALRYDETPEGEELDDP